MASKFAAFKSSCRNTAKRTKRRVTNLADLKHRMNWV